MDFWFECCDRLDSLIAYSLFVVLQIGIFWCRATFGSRPKWPVKTDPFAIYNGIMKMENNILFKFHKSNVD